MKTEVLLQALTEAPGISGDEREVAKIVRNYFVEYADDAYIDKFNNVIAVKKGEKSSGKIMLAAHIDQIGLMVNTIDENGFIGFVPIGGHDARVLIEQEVIIFGKKKLHGVIGAKPPHLQKPGEQNKVPPISELFIDTGLPAEYVKENVRPGDSIVFDSHCVELKNGRYSAAAMDDRSCIVVLIETLKYLKLFKHNWDVYAVATVQEEVGTRGASIVSYELKPDIGIAVDVTFGDFPGLSDRETVKLGEGGGIGFGANCHFGLSNELKKLAEEWNMPIQSEYMARPGGTDAYTIQVAYKGIPALQFSLPLRYMHTTVETIDMKDIKFMARELALFISKLDNYFKEVTP